MITFNHWPKKGNDKNCINSNATYMKKQWMKTNKKSGNVRKILDFLWEHQRGKFKGNLFIYDFHGDIIRTYIQKKKDNYYKNYNFILFRGHCFLMLPCKEVCESFWNISEPELLYSPEIKWEDKNYDEEMVKLNKLKKFKVSFINQNKKKLDYSEFIGAYDIETTEDSVKAYAIGIYIENDEYKDFFGLDCWTKFYLYLKDWTFRSSTTNNKLTLFAHFGGGFDFLPTLKALRKNILNMKISSSTEINGIMVNIKIYCPKLVDNKNLTLILKDSYPLLRSKLAQLTQDFEVEHLKGDLKHYLMTEEFFPQYEQKIRKYLTSDVLGLFEVLKKFENLVLQRWNIEKPLSYLTISSLAREIFKQKFWDNTKQIPNLPYLLDQFFRRAYYGGRTECFYIGEVVNWVYYYDFTSLYPFIMCGDLPYGMPRRRKGSKINLETFNGIVHFKAKNLDLLDYYLLPVKTEKGLIFPHLSDWTEFVLWSDEAKLAKKIGYQIEIIEGYEFKVAPYFVEVINDMFDLKKAALEEKKPGKKHLAKIAVNSLSGCWGIRTNKVKKLILKSCSEKELKKDVAKYLETNALMSLRSNKKNNLHFLRILENLDADYAYLPLSIATTSKARCHLYNLFLDVSKKGGKIFYCDTDSIITNFNVEEDDELGPRWCGKDGSKLGELKNEFGPKGKTFGAVFIAPKIYGFESGEIKFKGLDKDKTYTRYLKTLGIIKKYPANYKYREQYNLGDEIILKYDPLGKDKLDYKDLLCMNFGYKLTLDTWRFVSKIQGYMDKGKLSKRNVSITFKKNYIKGVVQQNGNVIPWDYNGYEVEKLSPNYFRITKDGYDFVSTLNFKDLFEILNPKEDEKIDWDLLNTMVGKYKN